MYLVCYVNYLIKLKSSRFELLCVLFKKNYVNVTFFYYEINATIIRMTQKYVTVGYISL